MSEQFGLFSKCVTHLAEVVVREYFGAGDDPAYGAFEVNGVHSTCASDADEFGDITVVVGYIRVYTGGGEADVTDLGVL